MNLFKLNLMSNKLINKKEIERRDRKYTISELIADPLPVLKEINPTKEEIDYFFSNAVITVQGTDRMYNEVYAQALYRNLMWMILSLQ